MPRRTPRFVQLAALFVLSTAAFADSRVVITEIMYNPASTEKKGEAEWVEIANVGDQPVEIKDWKLKVHDKKIKWGAFSCVLTPGSVAILVNDAATEEQFRAAWDQVANEGSAAPQLNYQVIPVKWGALANDVSEEHPLQLLNDKDEVVCEVKQAGEWPTVKGTGGPSIFIADITAADYSNGTLWRISQEGMDGARHNQMANLYDKQDCGSPGYVPGLGGNPASTTPATAVKAKKPKEDKEAETTEATAESDKGNKIDY